MNNQRGFFEELEIKDKDYPTSQAATPLAQVDYIEGLIHYAGRKIGDRFNYLVEEGNYSEIIRLTEEITKLADGSDGDFKLPLSNILYNYDNSELPVSDLYQLSKPDFISNEKGSMKNFFKSLKFELMTSDGADFMVSFLRFSGLQILLKPIEELAKRGKKVRIITSFYLNITEAKALKKLLELPNVEVKIIQTGNESFHTKAYLFHRESGFNSIIIGSSNISKSALVNGHEWNVKIPDSAYLPIYKQGKEKFNNLWNSPECLSLSDDLITQYELHSNNAKKEYIKPFKVAEENTRTLYDASIIQPNAMQRDALSALEQTREIGKTKGVVIAATGTGKTYLSAFDVKNFNPNRMLFLAHREDILVKSKETFKTVFNTEEHFGILSGNVKEQYQPYLFATVQTLSRDNVLNTFDPDYFDYIVIDEFHHAQASTYLKVINHFNPKFLLGLTATPERLDGQDVLQLCDYNVVYEIRLRDALEAELLAPFHYFGVADDTVDYEAIKIKNGFYDETELMHALKTEKRVEYVISTINKYSYSGDKLICLGFCSSIEHAKFMSEEFNVRGFVTTYLTGEHGPVERKETISKLEDENNSLQIIFTVDIFNEGIDIPNLNLVLFLRPTESPTIFIQQLGRGLRKSSNKEFVTILDFIGNYQKSFVVPLALSGHTNHNGFDKDSLRVAVQHEFADLPGGAYVDLDPVTQKRILEKIDSIRLDSIAVIKDLYNQFKKDLGRSPKITDFLYAEKAPNINFFLNKFKSWVGTKQKMNDIEEYDQAVIDNEYLYEVLERIESYYPIKWPYEFIILELALEKRSITFEDIAKIIKNRFGILIEISDHKSLIIRAMKRLSESFKKFTWCFGQIDNEIFIVEESFFQIDQLSKTQVKERIEYGIIQYRRMYQPQHLLKQNERLVKYQNYTRNDLIFLFEAQVQEGTWREGVSRVGNQYCLFINLNKHDKIDDHLKYHDYFMDPMNFHWQSQNQTTHESTRGQDYIHHKERDIHIHLFVRKFTEMHGMTLPFTYLGEIDYVSSKGNSPMNIHWRLQAPVPQDLFIDLIK